MGHTDKHSHRGNKRAGDQEIGAGHVEQWGRILTEASVAHWIRLVGSVPRKIRMTACSLVMTWALVWGMKESIACESLRGSQHQA